MTTQPGKRRFLRRVEDSTILDLSELKGWLLAGSREKEWYPHGVQDARRGSIRIVIEDKNAELWVTFAGNQHIIKLSSDSPRFGGRRWWLLCPLTGRRARRLYLFSGQDGFRHRNAVDPPFSYPTQRTSGLNRAIQQRDSVAKKLRTGYESFEGKPPQMRWKTYFRYLARVRRLDQKVTDIVLKKVLGKSFDDAC